MFQTTHPSSSGTEDKSLRNTFLEKALKENIRVRAQRLINKIQTLSHLKGGEITSVEPHVFFSSTGRQHMPVSLSHPARERNEPKLRSSSHLSLTNTCTPREQKPAGGACPPPEPTPPPCDTRTRGSSPLAMCAHFSLAQELVSQRGREKGEARGGRAAHRRRHKPCGALTKERGGGRGSRGRRAHGARGRTKGSSPAATPRGWRGAGGGTRPRARGRHAGTPGERGRDPRPRVPPLRAGQPRQGGSPAASPVPRLEGSGTIPGRDAGQRCPAAAPLCAPRRTAPPVTVVSNGLICSPARSSSIAAPPRSPGRQSERKGRGAADERRAGTGRGGCAAWRRRAAPVPSGRGGRDCSAAPGAEPGPPRRRARCPRPAPPAGPMAAAQRGRGPAPTARRGWSSAGRGGGALGPTRSRVAGPAPAPPPGPGAPPDTRDPIPVGPGAREGSELPALPVTTPA